MFFLIYEYTKCYVLEIIRNPSAAFFTLVFPALLLYIFGHVNTDNSHSIILNYIVYSNYAVQTIMFQTLGMSIALGKKNLFNEYLKTLPVSFFPTVMGRIISSLLLSVLSLSLVVLMFILNNSILISFKNHFIIIIVALMGGVPMALFGIFLGRFINPVLARNIFILLNLLLLLGAFALSDYGSAGWFREAVPSYQWFMMSIDMLDGRLPLIPLAWLGGYSLLCIFLIFL